MLLLSTTLRARDLKTTTTTMPLPLFPFSPPLHHLHHPKPTNFLLRHHPKPNTTTTFLQKRQSSKDLIHLGTPTPQLEKGKYSYQVSTLIEKLSSLPPRGSIARCLDSFRNSLSLPDFALVFLEFSRRRDWQRSLRLFKYMQRQPWCRPDEHIHALLISLLSHHSHLLDKALDIFFTDMPANNVPRTALSFTALIAAFARNSDPVSALELLGRMKSQEFGVAPNVLTYNTVLHACANAPEKIGFETVLQVFAEMRHDGIRPDLTTYNTMLAACAARGLGDDAEVAFRNAISAGITPDVTTFRYLIATFGPLKRLPVVNGLLREMEEEGNLPDVAAYNVLLEAYSKEGDTKMALGVLRQMQAAGCTPNADTYSVILGLYGRNRRYEDVRELFLEMKVGNTEPDASTYNILIQVFGEGGYFKEVVTLFHDMVEENVEPNMETYEGLMFACGRGGLHEDAKKIISHMNARGVVPSSKAYDGLIEAYGHAALYEEALVAFNNMNEIGSTPTVETYNALLRLYSRGGLLKESQAVMSRMNDAGVQRNDDTYNGLIEAHCQAGQFEDALKTYVEMQESRCNPNERTLEAVLNVYCSVGLVDESREQFEEIKSLGIMPSVIAYCMLLSVYAKNDMWDDANQLLEEMKMKRNSNTHQVIGSMITGDYDDESNWQMVEYVFDNFNSEGCGFGLRLYNSLLDALWWLNQKARAGRVLSEARRRGLFPELHRESKLVWSVDVHRMSVGGALAAISTWLNDIQENFEKGEDLPQLASVIVGRGEMEKITGARTFPVVKAAYTYLREHISSSFSFPGWNKGRITCQRAQLKRILSVKPDDSHGLSLHGKLVPISDSILPSPGTKIHTKGSMSSKQHDASDTYNIKDVEQTMESVAG